MGWAISQQLKKPLLLNLSSPFSQNEPTLYTRGSLEERAMQTRRHVVQTDPESFTAVWNELKTFHIARKGRRGFMDVDHLLLQEYGEGGYTGREIDAEITYIVDPDESGLGCGVREGYSAMAIDVLEKREGGHPAE